MIDSIYVKQINEKANLILRELADTIERFSDNEDMRVYTFNTVCINLTVTMIAAQMIGNHETIESFDEYANILINDIHANLKKNYHKFQKNIQKRIMDS